MTYSPEMLAMLEAQRAYFSSDDHIRREVEVWRDASPTERLAELAGMCVAGEYFMSQLGADAQEQLARPVALPDDTIAILAALRRSRP